MDPITLILLAAGAYYATKKKTPPPTPSGGGDAVKPDESGPAQPLDVKTESGSGSSERLAAIKRKVTAKINKAVKTSNFGGLSLAELNQINPAKLRNQAERERFLLVRKRAAAQAK